jgi:hypothetical protein
MATRDGRGRALVITVSVSVLAGVVSWVVVVFTLVKALIGEGVGLAWAVLLFLTPAVSVLALGTLALRLLRPPAE